MSDYPPDDSRKRADDPDEAVDPGATLRGDASEADVSEQRRELFEHGHRIPDHLPDDVNPADALEQERDAGDDEDEYR